MNSQLRPTLGKSNQILFVDVIVVKNLRKVQHSLIFGWNYHGHISRHWKFELGPQILPVLISAIDIPQFIYVTTPLLSLRVLQNVSLLYFKILHFFCIINGNSFLSVISLHSSPFMLRRNHITYEALPFFSPTLALFLAQSFFPFHCIHSVAH